MLSRSSVQQKALLRYLLVGGASVVIDVGTLYLMHSVGQVALAPATVTAFLASVAFNFALNRMGMSSTGAAGMTRHIVRYMALVAANLVVTVIVVAGGAHLGVPYLLAKIAVVLASTGWNFLLYQHWVFTPPADRTGTMAR